MPRTLYLHVGLPKTASTFLQARIFPTLENRRVINTPDDTYFSEPGQERLLSRLFTRSDTIWSHAADDVFDTLLGPGWRSDARDILISDEAIGRTAGRQGLFSAHLAGLTAAARERGIEQVKLLCFVRRQDHWLASHHVQMSDRLAAGQAAFEKLVADICDPRRDRFKLGALLDYAAIRSAAEAALGADAIAFYPMEWLESRPDHLAERLAGFLDLPVSALRLGAPQENVRRAGAGRWALRRPSSARALISSLFRRGRNYIQLTPDLSTKILDTYRESNLELQEATGVDLQTLGYFPDADGAFQGLSGVG